MCAQVVRLEVGDPVARLGADDGAPVDADDVARAVERDGLVTGRGVGAAAELVAVDARAARRPCARTFDVGVDVGGGDLVGEALAQPGRNE